MVMDLPSRYGPSRRGRGPNNNNKSNNQAIVSCLVDGCNSDLSKGRDYHRRHKVCEIHSKTPKVTIRGQEQRFCQQCSRFHSLVEFDDVKRSCRKRLDGHNRRRRKPQPPESSSILLNSTAQFLSHFQGAAKYVETTGTGPGPGPGPPQVYPTASFSFGTDFFSRSHFDLGDKKAQSSSSSSSSMPFSHSSFGQEQIQFPFFWQGGTTSQQEPFVSEPPISSTAAPGMRMNGGGCNQELFLGSESSNDRALSLLSSLLPPPQTEASVPEEGRSRNVVVAAHHPEDVGFR